MSRTDVAPTQPAPKSVPVADADHLRRVVEKQPACLMRVGADGLILAANDAALGLLGTQLPSEVLGGTLTTWIVPAHRDAWTSFAKAVVTGASQSVECDLTDVSGLQRSVVFHGVPLVDHADGVPSLILGVRDATGLRRLEAALQESEAARQKLGTAQGQPPADHTSGQLQDLEMKLQEAHADRDRLEKALSKLPQLEQLLKAGRTHLQDLRSRLDDATKEKDQLAARLSEREAANEQLWTEQAELQQTLSEQQQLELNDLRMQLQNASLVQDEAAGRLRYQEAEQERMRSEQLQLQVSLEAAQQELGAARTRLDEVTSEKDQLLSQLAERIGEHERMLTEQEDRRRHEEERQRVEAEQLHQTLDGHRQQLSSLRSQFEDASTDRDQLADQLRESEAHRERLAADHSSERARMEDALASSRQEVEQLRADAARAVSLARQILEMSQSARSEERT